MLEIEAKIKVAALEPIRQTLQRLSAQRLHAVTEVNMFFDRSDRSLLAAACGLRVRIETSPELPEPKATITFKGPKQDSPFHPREAFDLVTTPVADAVPFLQALGFVRTLSFEKHRESWIYGGCRVELDELPHLGTFVEIEGPAAAAIANVRQALGLDHQDLCNDSYIAMIARYVDEHPSAERAITFG